MTEVPDSAAAGMQVCLILARQVLSRSMVVGRTQGKVKWFNDQKGFGFICGEGGQDIFVHHTTIVSEGFRTLKEGETVEFDCEPGPKGLKATNVKRLEVGAPAQ